MGLEEYKEFVLRTDVPTLEEELKILRRMFKEECSDEIVQKMFLVKNVIKTKTDEILNNKKPSKI